MPAVTPATQLQTPVTPGNPALLTPASRTSADFNMFLKLLTTQMQNQDPLDPMDTSEYTNQLVQFSQVEQTLQQTGTLKEILSRLTTDGMAQASAFIGREAQFASPVSGLSATEPATWGYTTARPAASMVATITDARGAVVDVRTLEADGTGRFAWNGRLANGARAPAGAYSLSLTAADAGGTAVPATVSSIGTVDEVLTANGAVSLGVNGVQLPASALIRVSQAG